MKPIDAAPYERIVAVVRRKGPLARHQLEDALRLTPGLFFALPTTWDRVLRSAVAGGWLNEEAGIYSAPR